MQTLTILFAFAIVAIAIENFTAEFLRVENSDADAKGLPEVQSRADGRFPYTLRGVTGIEKVTITDGNEVENRTLDKETEFLAKNPKIVIDFTNDECCKPDRNIMFKSAYPNKVSTENNTFPQNYQTKWNCSSCPHNRMQDAKKRMNLLSRVELDDRCDVVRNTPDDFCDNCKILEEGPTKQFCHPGKYTIEFETKGQCKGVTFGGCKDPTTARNYEEPTKDAQQCSKICSTQADCNFYKYNRDTGNCTFMMDQNRGLYCNIWAGPREKTGTQCLNMDNDQFCDYQLQEECEYDGKLLIRNPKGRITSPAGCQLDCKNREPLCKSWIYHRDEKLCILMRDEQKKCAVWAGVKEYTFDQCDKINNPINEKR